MAVRVGDKVPSAKFRTRTADGVKEITSDELFAGKKVVLFAVPGAFTPTCSDAHLPGFIVRGPEIKAKGVDTIACVAVNDHFVLEAWAKSRGAGDNVLMLADGNGDFATAMGLVLDLSHIGLGKRSRRYAAIVDDGVIRLLNVEPGPAVEGSSAEAVLAAL